MSRIKFDGFTQNYDVSKAKLDKGGLDLVKSTIMEIVHRYKDSDPAFTATSRIEKLGFGKRIIDPDWRVNFDGELYTDSDSVALGLVNDTKNPKKDDEGLGLTQTFTYKGDTFQIYVNFREPIIG